jgi:hypothetical protein
LSKIFYDQKRTMSKQNEDNLNYQENEDNIIHDFLFVSNVLSLMWTLNTRTAVVTGDYINEKYTSLTAFVCPTF